MDEPDFLASRLHRNAVIRSLEVIGEAANKVSVPTREARSDIPWREVIGMRHRLIHGYADIRLEVVWHVVRDRLGPLIAALQAVVPDEDDAGV